MTTATPRPKLSPSGHQPYQVDRAMGILKGRRDGETFAELAKRYGISVQRVSQIYWQVIRRGGVPSVGSDQG